MSSRRLLGSSSAGSTDAGAPGDVARVAANEGIAPRAPSDSPGKEAAGEPRGIVAEGSAGPGGEGAGPGSASGPPVRVTATSVRAAAGVTIRAGIRNGRL